MSLEAVLEAHTCAMQENTSIMRQLVDAWKALSANANAMAIKPGQAFTAGGVPMRLETNPASELPRETDEPETTVATHLAPGKATAKVAAPKPAVVSPPTQTAAAKPASEPKASPPAPSTATVTYEDVRTLVLQVSKEKGRDVAAAVLALFGVAKAPELKPEQYADAVAHFKSELRV